MLKKYPTTEQVKEYLYKYIPNNKQDKKGLFLLPAQTGSGKTHATVQYMSERIKSGSKENMIYIVNIIKSVRETYHKLLDELSIEEQKKVLWLKNNHDSVIDFFKNSKNLEELTYLDNFTEFRKLKENVLFAIKHNTVDDEITKEIINKLSKTLQNALIKSYKESKPDGFRNEVAMLYPTVRLKDYSAVFMTTAKFFFAVFDLDGSYIINSSSKFKGSVLFMDEFDTQKKIILNNIIKDGNRYKYEMFDIVISIENALRNKNYVKKYNVEQEVIDNILEFYNSIFNKYKIARGFKYEFEKEETINTMLMDSGGATFINSRGRAMKTVCSNDDAINIVGLKGEVYFVDIARDVTLALKRYLGLCKKIVADKIHNIGDTVKKDEVQEAIIYDLVKETGTSHGDNHYKYLSDTIRNELFQSKQIISTSRNNLYENGFSIIDVKQKSTESVTTDFELFLLSDTPEKFLKKTCENMFVVAISATCSLKTVIRNFDLDYLQKELQDDYKTLSDDEVRSMNSLYIHAKKQENREIAIEYIDSSYDGVEMSKKYFDADMNFYEGYIKDLKRRRGDYYFEQYERILHCYKEFLLHDDIESFMHLQSNFPKDGLDASKSGIYKQEILVLIFEMMIANKLKLSQFIQEKITRLELKRKELKNEAFIKYLIDEHELIYFYNSNKDNQSTYNKVLDKKIKDGDKIYLMSSYLTIGSGVNMEYIARDGIKKDFDAIFMSNTTSIISKFYNIASDTSKDINNKKIVALYELESLSILGYYSPSDYKRIAQHILKFSPQLSMNYRDTTDYINSSMGMLIQAIGRLYRTDDISKMYIYISDELRNVVSNFDSSKIALLPAVKQLISKTTSEQTTDDIKRAKDGRIKKEIEQSKNVFNRNNDSVNKFINYMLKVFNGKDIKEIHVEEWESKRQYLVSNPTINNKNSIHVNCYGKMPIEHSSEYSYWYSQEDDYREIEIDFKSKKTGSIEVSAKSAMLDVIANTKELQGCVIENKIALKFEYQHIMIPIAFNNLYKGAMGEVLGKYILNNYCDVELKSLGINSDDGYERFDYKTNNNIYIDFKYYSQSTLQTTEIDKINKWAKEKMKSMRGSRAIIINIFADSSGKSEYINTKGDVVIVPFLIDIKERERPKLNQNAMHIIRGICNES